jgi:hypothetical protein
MLKKLSGLKIGTSLFIRHYAQVKQEIVDSIKSAVGSANFVQTESVRNHYSKDESFHKYSSFFLH